MAKPRPNLRLVFSDQWGKVFADEFGHLYRGPSYAARFDELGIADPVDHGGWESTGTGWYRSKYPSPKYIPSEKEKILHGLRSIAWIAVAFAAVWTLPQLSAVALAFAPRKNRP